jgi:hypothetical protein
MFAFHERLIAEDHVALHAPTARRTEEKLRAIAAQEKQHRDRANNAVQSAAEAELEEGPEDFAKRQSRIAVEIFDELLFGTDAAEELSAAHNRIEQLLQQRIRDTVWICGLTGVQKEKLDLAGRGDITRLFQNIEEQKRAFQIVNYKDIDEAVIKRMSRETARLQLMLRSDDLFHEGSLFAKTIKGALTVEQAGKYALIREIARVGGVVRRRKYRSDEVNEVRLSTAAITDEDLPQLVKIANVQFLALDATQITDAGLANLQGLTELKILDLARTQLTDEGLVHLKGLSKLTELDLTGTLVTDGKLRDLQSLKNLQRLYLSRTKVTDAGVAELERAMPGVTIHR